MGDGGGEKEQLLPVATTPSQTPLNPQSAHRACREPQNPVVCV